MANYCDEVQTQMSADFKRASEDGALLELTEWGMDDYHNIVSPQNTVSSKSLTELYQQ